MSKYVEDFQPVSEYTSDFEPVGLASASHGYTGTWEEPSAIKELGRGFVEGLMGNPETVGTIAKIAGSKKIGPAIEEKSRAIADKYRMPEQLQGKVVEEPSLLAEPAWWTHGIGQMAGSMVGPVGAGGAAFKTTKVLLNRVMRNPKTVAKAAKYIGLGAGGAAGGMMEGSGTYNQVLEETGDEKKALRSGALMAVGSAVLNSASFGSMLTPKVKSKLLHVITSGIMEGATEQAEEPWEALVTGKPEEAVQRWIDGFNVFLPAMVTGGIGGLGGLASAGGAQDSVFTKDEHDEINSAFSSALEDAEIPNVLRNVQRGMNAVKKRPAEARPTILGEQPSASGAKLVDAGGRPLRTETARQKPGFLRTASDMVDLRKADEEEGPGIIQPLGVQSAPRETTTYPKKSLFVVRKKEDIPVQEETLPGDVVVENKPVATASGKPFKTEVSARNRMQKLGFTPETHDLVKVEGGFVIQEKGRTIPGTEIQPGASKGPSLFGAKKKQAERLNTISPIQEPLNKKEVAKDNLNMVSSEQTMGDKAIPVEPTSPGRKLPRSSITPEQKAIWKKAHDLYREADSKIADDLRKEYGRNLRLIGKTGNGSDVILTPSARSDGKHQFTFFTKEGIPAGHEEYSTPQEGIKAFMEWTRVKRPDLHDDFLLSPDTPMEYVYESRLRPLGPGAAPKENLVGYENGGKFGRAVYSFPLTEEQIDHFSFTPIESRKPQHPEYVHKTGMITKNDQSKIVNKQSISQEAPNGQTQGQGLLKSEPPAPLSAKPAETRNSGGVSLERPSIAPKATDAAGEAVAKGKEPWEITQVAALQRDAKDILPIKGRAEIRNGKPVYIFDTTVRWDDADRTFSFESKSQPNTARLVEKLHKQIVQQAISEGKPVPKEVLADYPDLTVKPAPEKSSPVQAPAPEKTTPVASNEISTKPVVVHETPVRETQKIEPGSAYVGPRGREMWRPFTEFKEVVRGKNKGRFVIAVAGKKYLVDKGAVRKWPGSVQGAPKEESRPATSREVQGGVEKKEGGIVARTKPRERETVDNGTLYGEYRVRKITDQEYWDHPEFHHRGKAYDGRYILEQRTVKTDSGKIDEVGEWETIGIGKTKKDAIEGNISDASFRDAESLDDTHRAVVDKINSEKAAEEAQKKAEDDAKERGRSLRVEYDSYLAEKMPKGKKGTITIASYGEDGKAASKDVDATIYGDWAINPYEWNKKKKYPVTHIPSGRMVAEFSSIGDAKKAITAIHDSGVKVLKDITSTPKDSINTLLSIVKYVRDGADVPGYYQDRQAEPAQERSGKKAETIQDFGEKIGGARKDTAERGFTKSSAKKDDGTPAWRKRYVAAKRTDGSEEWSIIDTKNRFGGNLRQRFKSQEEAEKAIPLFAVAQKHTVHQNKEGAFSIYKRTGERKIFKVVSQDFPSREEGMKYMAEHAEEILNIKTAFGEEILPVPDVVQRRGAERRTGPSTPEMFMETFAPRAIEFGNWNNQEERQAVMDHAYDGLLDLADTLGVPPKALMLDGDLAIAFGARGQGLSGAKAHYEPGYGVINLTKMKGAGSLAHEWFHALDHYFARLDTKAKSEKETNSRGDLVYPESSDKYTFITHGASYKSKLRPEIQSAYKDLIEGMYRKAEQYVEDTERADDFLSVARGHLKEKLDGVRKNLERDLSKEYTFRKNKKGLLPASTEQLAEFDRLADVLMEGGNLETSFRHNEESRPEGGVKPKGMNRSLFGRLLAGRHSNDTLDAMNTILKSVRNRSGFNKEGYGALDQVRAAMTTYAARIKMFEDAKAGTEKTKKIPTNFAIEAKKMDQARTGDYWSEPHEMAARAFSSYVEDKIAEQGGQSDFLVYHAHGGILLPMIDGYIARPYPEGAERDAINKSFDAFVKTLNVKETEKGTALFQKRTGAGGLSAPAIEKAIASVAAKWKNAPSINVVQSVAELPPAIRKQISEGDVIGGAFYDGTVYVVAEGTDSVADAQRTILHETIAHWGLRKTFGPNLDPVLRGIYNAMDKADLRRIADLYGFDLGNPSDQLDCVEEYMASVAEQGRKPAVWDRMVRWIRRALTRMGFPLKPTKGDVDGMIADALGKARKYVEGGESPFVTGYRNGRAMFKTAAFHGSPYDVTKSPEGRFSTNYIGSGEGARAYGYGLYFAGKREVAEYYRKLLSDPLNPYWIIDGEKISQTVFTPEELDFLKDAKAEGSPERALSLYVELEESDTKNVGRFDALKEAGKRFIGKKIERPGKGHLYEVELAPDEDEYLLWDKPLSEQSEKVKEALSDSMGSAILKDGDGRNLYHHLSSNMSLGSDKAASEYLHSLGIRGIKYLDGTSRGKGEGAYNYVIFSDEDVSIKGMFRKKDITETPEFKKWSGGAPVIDDASAKANTVDTEKLWQDVRYLEQLKRDQDAYLYHLQVRLGKEKKWWEENVKDPENPTEAEMNAALDKGIIPPFKNDWEAVRSQDRERLAEVEKKIAELQPTIQERSDKKEHFQNGKPFVARVYHATPFGGISGGAFDPQFLGENTKAGSATLAYFFSGDKRTSDEYSRGDAINQRGFVRLSADQKHILLESIKEDLDNQAYENGEEYFDGSVEDWAEDNPEYVRELANDLFPNNSDYDSRPITPKTHELFINLKNPYVRDFKGERYREESYYDLLKKAKDKGHDGAVLLNTYDGGPKDNIFAVFPGHEAQIKSVNNRGTFDPENPNILFRKKEADEAYEKATSSVISKLTNQTFRDSIYTSKPAVLARAAARYIAVRPAKILQREAPKAGAKAVRIQQEVVTTARKLKGRWESILDRASEKLTKADRAWVRDKMFDAYQGGQKMPNVRIQAFADAWEQISDEVIRRARKLGVMEKVRVGDWAVYKNGDRPIRAFTDKAELKKWMDERTDQGELAVVYRPNAKEITRPISKIEHYFSHILTHDAREALVLQRGELFDAIVEASHIHGFDMKPLLNEVAVETKAKRNANLEHARQANIPTSVKVNGKEVNILESNPFELIQRHIEGTANRLSIIEQFGQEGAEKAFQDIYDAIRKESSSETAEQWKWMWQDMNGTTRDMIFHHMPRALAHFGSGAQAYASAAMLSLASISNVISGPVPMAIRFGLGNTTKAWAKIAANSIGRRFGVRMPETEALLEQFKEMGGWSKSTLRMTSDTEMLHEQAARYAETAMKWLGMDAANRHLNKVANLAAHYAMTDAIESLRDGTDTGGLKALWGMDAKGLKEMLKTEGGWSDEDLARILKDGVTEDDAARFIQRSSTMTNVFMESAETRPQALGNGFWRRVFAYTSYFRMFGNTAMDTLSYAKKGNYRPLMMLLLGAPAMALLDDAVRDFLKGTVDQGESFAERLVEAVMGSGALGLPGTWYKSFKWWYKDGDAPFGMPVLEWYGKLANGVCRSAQKAFSDEYDADEAAFEAYRTAVKSSGILRVVDNLMDGPYAEYLEDRYGEGRKRVRRPRRVRRSRRESR